MSDIVLMMRYHLSDSVASRFYTRRGNGRHVITGGEDSRMGGERNYLEACQRDNHFPQRISLLLVVDHHPHFIINLRDRAVVWVSEASGRAGRRGHE